MPDALRGRPDRSLIGLHIRDGAEVGRYHKKPFLAPEAGAFRQDYNPGDDGRLDRITIAMVCSDLLFHRTEGQGQMGMPGVDLHARYIDPIRPDVRTLLVNGRWITPTPGMQEATPAIEYLRFIAPLEYTARYLLSRHPNLQEIIMADQLPPDAWASGPANFHARRA